MATFPQPFDFYVFRLFPIFISLLGIGLRADGAIAQVNGDQTLPTGENTVVSLVGGVYTITGGSNQGDNLFHSFEQFSISEGEKAFFNHGSNIDTIIGRVTGGLVSNIDGIINVDTAISSADIFLINPQGVVFGPNSSLDIGGSFIVSTAEEIVFTDGVEFSAIGSQPTRLTISQPIGLILGNSSRNIVNESVAGDFGAGLRVPDRETIAFVSSGIDLRGGRMTALSGRIELASLASGNSVTLVAPDTSTSSNWVLDYAEEDFRFRDIQLSSGAFLEASSDFSNNPNPSGSIQLRGRRITVNSRDGGIRSDNYGSLPGNSFFIFASEQFVLSNQSLISVSAYGNGEGGDLTIEAPEATIKISESSRLLAQSEKGTTGRAGTLSIRAGNLSIQDRSEISTATFSQGDGGTLTIDVADGTVELLGDSRILSRSNTGATGAAGNLNIYAEKLSVQDGSNISTGTDGSGQGGSLRISTPNGIIEVVGVSSDGKNLPSTISSVTQGAQNAGELRIDTQNLLVQDGGKIQSGTFGSGNGGRTLINATELVRVSGEMGGSASQISSSNNRDGGDTGTVEILTRRLLVEDGANVFTSTNGTGQGGDLIIFADEVILSGQGARSSGLFARTEGSGDSGRLTLTTDSLLIEDGARFTVSTDEDAILDDLGTVRDANITARTITLNNGQITAEALSGNGGNLNFNVQDAILLRNNSLISATAGTAESGGDGGNVNINMPDGFVIAVPDENSDIIANAFSGTGGSIDITTQNIIGLEARPAFPANNTNDIDASSQFGTSGTITINDLELDPTQGLIELPTEPAEPNQVAQRCAADSGQQSTFVDTGQGGVPPTPREVVRNEATTLVDLDSGINNNDVVSSIPEQNNTVVTNDPAEQPLVEAQGWYRNKAGTVTLIAQEPTANVVINTHQQPCAELGRE